MPEKVFFALKENGELVTPPAYRSAPYVYTTLRAARCQRTMLTKAQRGENIEIVRYLPASDLTKEEAEQLLVVADQLEESGLPPGIVGKLRRLVENYA